MVCRIEFSHLKRSRCQVWQNIRNISKTKLQDNIHQFHETSFMGFNGMTLFILRSMKMKQMALGWYHTRYICFNGMTLFILRSMKMKQMALGWYHTRYICFNGMTLFILRSMKMKQMALGWYHTRYICFNGMTLFILRSMKMKQMALGWYHTRYICFNGMTLFILRSMRIKQMALGWYHTDVAIGCSNLSRYYSHLEDHAMEEKYLKDAVDIYDVSIQRNELVKTRIEALRSELITRRGR